ncbi:hypothetical protein [Uliginosibacterium sp. H1]|nr:hypothetical protein [Uliginosibacterium sp. H1]
MYATSSRSYAHAAADGETLRLAGASPLALLLLAAHGALRRLLSR